MLGGLKKILNTELAKAKTSHTMSKEVGGHHLLPGHCRVVIDGLMMKKKRTEIYLTLNLFSVRVLL